MRITSNITCFIRLGMTNHDPLNICLAKRLKARPQVLCPVFTKALQPQRLGLRNQFISKGFTDGQQLHLIGRSEEHTSELQSRGHLVCRLLLEKKKETNLFPD